jgi:O-antigen/teichoic acid export membrane protein
MVATIQAIQSRMKVRLTELRSVDSLRFRTIRASAWTIGGYGINQVLRLGGNLLLTRLLFPEAFGLMAIVMSVMAGLSMLSDIGVEPSIIQNKRGEEPTFINTAWTIQVFQGFAIWLAICVLAHPIAHFYKAPALAGLLPVAGFGAVFGGFSSTKLALSARNLALRRRVQLEVGSYFVGLVVMVVWAWLDHTIWSLVGGNLVQAALKMAGSHIYLPGIRNRLTYAKDAFKELFGFGQWVLVSSMITYVAGEGNKLLVGGFLGVKLLAFFTLASTFTGLFWQVASQLNSYVLFPAYSEVVRNRPERLKDAVARIRLLLLLPGWASAVFFVFFGDHFMRLLYDPRYAESGAMLQMLGLGQLVGAIGGAYIGLLWAKGMVATSTVLLAVQVAIQLLGMVLGNYFFGARGVIVSAAAVGWLIYPAMAYVYARLGLWQARIDLPLIAISILIALLTFHGIYVHL